jgi:hypothetical protein
MSIAGVTKLVGKPLLGWAAKAIGPLADATFAKYSDYQFGSHMQKAEEQVADTFKYLNNLLDEYATSGGLSKEEHKLFSELNVSQLEGTDADKQKAISDIYLEIYSLSLEGSKPTNNIETFMSDSNESIAKLAFKISETQDTLTKTTAYFEQAKDYGYDNVLKSINSSGFDIEPTKLNEFKESLTGIEKSAVFNVDSGLKYKLSQMIEKIKSEPVLHDQIEESIKKNTAFHLYKEPTPAINMVVVNKTINIVAGRMKEIRQKAEDAAKGKLISDSKNVVQASFG